MGIVVSGYPGCLRPKFGSDQCAAQAGEHVVVAGRSLGLVSRRGSGAVLDVLVGAAVELAPGDQKGLAEKPE